MSSGSALAWASPLAWIYASVVGTWSVSHWGWPGRNLILTVRSLLMIIFDFRFNNLKIRNMLPTDAMLGFVIMTSLLGIRWDLFST